MIRRPGWNSRCSESPRHWRRRRAPSPGRRCRRWTGPPRHHRRCRWWSRNGRWPGRRPPPSRHRPRWGHRRQPLRGRPEGADGPSRSSSHSRSRCPSPRPRPRRTPNRRIGIGSTEHTIVGRARGVGPGRGPAVGRKPAAIATVTPHAEIGDRRQPRRTPSSVEPEGRPRSRRSSRNRHRAGVDGHGHPARRDGASTSASPTGPSTHGSESVVVEPVQSVSPRASTATVTRTPRRAHRRRRSRGARRRSRPRIGPEPVVVPQLVLPSAVTATLTPHTSTGASASMSPTPSSAAGVACRWSSNHRSRSNRSAIRGPR